MLSTCYKHVAGPKVDGDVKEKDANIIHNSTDQSFTTTTVMSEASSSSEIVISKDSTIGVTAVESTSVKVNDTNMHESCSVYSWGRNSHNALGLASPVRMEPLPALVNSLECRNVKAIAAGKSHTLILDEYGRIYGFGRAREGQLATDESIDIVIPREIDALGELGKRKCVAIACGDGSSAAITSSGELFEWGFLHEYTPSTGSEVSGKQDLAMPRIRGRGVSAVPSNALPGLAQAAHEKMSDKLKEMLRKSTLIYLTSGGDGMGGYSNEQGQASMVASVVESSASSSQDEEDGDYETVKADVGILSMRTRRMMIRTPTLCRSIPENEKVKQVSLGYGHTLILLESGIVMSKGYNDRGQLGIGSRV